MSGSPKLVKETTKKPVQHPALLLAFTALDTTWRTLVPGIIGVILGIYLDHSWHTTPLLTVSCLVIGISLSAYLIYRQFRMVSR